MRLNLLTTLLVIAAILVVAESSKSKSKKANVAKPTAPSEAQETPKKGSGPKAAVEKPSKKTSKAEQERLDKEAAAKLREQEEKEKKRQEEETRRQEEAAKQAKGKAKKDKAKAAAEPAPAVEKSVYETVIAPHNSQLYARYDEFQNLNKNSPAGLIRSRDMSEIAYDVILANYDTLKVITTKENALYLKRFLDFDDKLGERFSRIFALPFYHEMPYELKWLFAIFMDALLDPLLEKYRRQTNLKENPPAPEITSAFTLPRIMTEEDKKFISMYDSLEANKPHQQINIIYDDELENTEFAVRCTPLSAPTSQHLLIHPLRSVEALAKEMKLTPAKDYKYSLTSYTTYLCNSPQSKFKQPFRLIYSKFVIQGVEAHSFKTYSFEDPARRVQIAHIDKFKFDISDYVTAEEYMEAHKEESAPEGEAKPQVSEA